MFLVIFLQKHYVAIRKVYRRLFSDHYWTFRLQLFLLIFLPVWRQVISEEYSRRWVYNCHIHVMIIITQLIDVTEQYNKQVSEPILIWIYVLYELNVVHFQLLLLQSFQRNKISKNTTKTTELNEWRSCNAENPTPVWCMNKNDTKAEIEIVSKSTTVHIYSAKILFIINVHLE